MPEAEPMHRLIPQSNDTLISAHKQEGRNVWDIHVIHPDQAHVAMEIYELRKTIKGVKMTMVPNAMVVIYSEDKPVARVGLATEDRIHEALEIGLQTFIVNKPITWDDIPME